MRFRPRQGWPTWVACALVLGILAADVLLLRGMYRQPLGSLGVVRGLPLALSGLLLGALAAWLYAHLGISYHVDRNRLAINCVAARHVVPLASISEIVAVDASELHDFVGVRRFGLFIGRAALAPVGPVWCCALRTQGHYWRVSTPEASFILSPDNDRFVEACWERKALGPSRVVASSQSSLRLPTGSFLRDLGALGLVFVGLWLSLALFGYVGFQSQAGLSGHALRPGQILQLPLIGLLSWAMNSLLGVLLHSKNKMIAYLLFAATLLVSLLLWRAALRVMPASAGARLAFQLLAGAILSGAIAVLGFYRKALSSSGALGALALGTVIFGFGGWIWGMLLIGFFLSSTALSKYQQGKKEKVAEKFAKGSRRDIGQALANGGLGALVAVASYIWPNPSWLPLFAGVMAAVNADTWATEVGVLSKGLPRLITSWRVVPVGTSGGVSLLGSLASLSGGLFIGLLGSALIAVDAFVRHLGVPSSVLWLPLAALGGGAIGSLADSLLGATLQGIYHCDACGIETERTMHRCGQQTRLVRGWRWLNNDWVNLLSSGVGGLVAFALARLLA